MDSFAIFQPDYLQELENEQKQLFAIVKQFQKLAELLRFQIFTNLERRNCDRKVLNHLSVTGYDVADDARRNNPEN